jgi:actinin alpha
VDFQRIMANVDPTQTGFVTFESFLDFMTRECSEEDSVDQLTLAFKTLSGDKVNLMNKKKENQCFLFF